MTDLPWGRAPLQYVGWVPNALGHLSFSLIGQGTSPDANAAARAGHQDGQHVLAHQVRYADDYFLPNWIMRWFRPGAIHDWLLIGSTAAANYPSGRSEGGVFEDDRGMLLGTIYLSAMPEDRRPWRSGWWKAVALRHDFRVEAKKIIKGATAACSKPENPHLAGQLDAHNRQMEALVEKKRGEGAHFTEIRFALIRTGEARFWIEEEDQFLPAADAGALAAAGAAPPPSQNITVKSAYLFLKDISHRHAHHHPSQDSMLPIVPVRTGEDEIEWQRQTIWALSRTIEDNIRRAKRKSLREALGMIPFAENFHSLYASLVRSKRGEKGFEKTDRLDHYSFEPLRKSITIQLEVRIWRLAAITAALTSVFAITLSTIIAIENVASSGVPHWPAGFGQAVENAPEWFLGSIVGPFVLFYLWLFSEAEMPSFIFTPLRFVTRLTTATTISLYRRMRLPRWGARAIKATVQLGVAVLLIWALVRLLGP